MAERANDCVSKLLTPYFKLAGKFWIVQGMINLADSVCKAGALAAVPALGFPHLPFVPAPVPRRGLTPLLAGLRFEQHGGAGYPSLPSPEAVPAPSPCVIALTQINLIVGCRAGPQSGLPCRTRGWRGLAMPGGGQQGAAVPQGHPGHGTVALELLHWLFCVG